MLCFRTRRRWYYAPTSAFATHSTRVRRTSLDVSWAHSVACEPSTSRSSAVAAFALVFIVLRCFLRVCFRFIVLQFRKFLFWVCTNSARLVIWWHIGVLSDCFMYTRQNGVKVIDVISYKSRSQDSNMKLRRLLIHTFANAALLLLRLCEVLPFTVLSLRHLQ